MLVSPEVTVKPSAQCSGAITDLTDSKRVCCLRL